MEFDVLDMVLWKVSPWKGGIRFRKQEKLGLQFIGPFQVVARVGEVAYWLELFEELSQIHSTFHVFQHRKLLMDDTLVVPLDEI